MKHLLTVLISLSGAVVFSSTVNLPRPVTEKMVVANTPLQPGIFYDTDGTAEMLQEPELEPRSLDRDYLRFVQGFTEEGDVLYEKSNESSEKTEHHDRLVLVRGQF